MKPTPTLRDLFWLVLVCGLALEWWLEHRHAQDCKRELTSARQALELMREATADLLNASRENR